MPDIKKVVIIGPESTGKSSLCQQLAAHYNTIWCREYAREYLLQHGTDYTYDDLLMIAKGQVQREEEALIEASKMVNHVQPEPPGAPVLIIDTDMYVMKVWCEFVFGKCHAFIKEQITKRTYDLYLLCNTDLPWVKDELREYPDLETRETLFVIYKNLLSSQPVPWINISGNYDERLTKAIAGINNLLR